MVQNILSKSTNYNGVKSVIKTIFKANLFYKHTGIKEYKTIARTILVHGCKAWTIQETDKKRLTANELKFFKNRTLCNNGITKGMPIFVRNFMQYHFFSILEIIYINSPTLHYMNKYRIP